MSDPVDRKHDWLVRAALAEQRRREAERQKQEEARRNQNAKKPVELPHRAG